MAEPVPESLPKYIVLEGIDGTGKSTLAAGLADWLRTFGEEVVVTEEPTRGSFGLQIRKLLGETSRTVPVDEWLSLFEQDRRQHMEQVVRPALQRGAWVVQDRSFYSTAAYQGAQGADVTEILRRNRAFAVEPGLVILLVLEPGPALARTRARPGMEAEVFEREGFLTRVARVFAGLKAPNLVRIDAARPANVVLARSTQAVVERFKLPIAKNAP